jgi:hypothetical protein
MASNKRQVAALAKSYADHSLNMKSYLDRHPGALDLVDEIKAAIQEKKIPLYGTPYEIIAMAHHHVLQRNRDLSKPGSLEMTMREEQESK